MDLFLCPSPGTTLAPDSGSPGPRAQEWIDLSGPDAGDFLQRLTTVNAGGLLPGQGAPGFFLTAQGKIRAVFRLWRYGAENYGFEVDCSPLPAGGTWKQRLLETIDQFTFAEKMVLTEVSELRCAWLFGDFMPEGEAGTTLAIDDEIRLCFQGTRDFGRRWITAWGRETRLRQWLENSLGLPGTSVSWEELERWRIEALRAGIPAEITPEVSPLEIGWTDGIASNKGCYPGQEVIERIISLGAPARRLTLIEGAGPAPRPGAALFNLAEPPVQVGTITSAGPAPTQGAFRALALVQKLHAKENLPVRVETQTGDAASTAQIQQVAPFA
jgi:folate-binding protein YgfZ